MNISTLELIPNQSKRKIGDAYLKLQINEQIVAALPMKHTQEVLVMPVHRITLMPNMPDCVLGLMNQRSRVFWLIDLSQMLGFSPIDADIQDYNIAIIRVGKIPLGLVVQEVKGVMRFTSESIQSPMGTLTAGLTPYLQGCILQENGVLLVLDAEAIVNANILHSNQ